MKTMLMASAAVLAALPAYAQPYQPPYQQPRPYPPPNHGLIPLGTSGVWSAALVTNGAGACLLATRGPNGGALFIGTAGANQVLTFGFDKPSWNIPASATPWVAFRNSCGCRCQQSQPEPGLVRQRHS